MTKSVRQTDRPKRSKLYPLLTRGNTDKNTTINLIIKIPKEATQLFTLGLNVYCALLLLRTVKETGYGHAPVEIRRRRRRWCRRWSRIDSMSLMSRRESRRQHYRQAAGRKPVSYCPVRTDRRRRVAHRTFVIGRCTCIDRHSRTVPV